MKIVIFMLGLVVLTAVQAEPINKKLIKQINALESEIKSILNENTSIKRKELPNLSQKIFKIAELNKFVIEAEQELKKNSGKPSTKECQALLNANLKSVVDQITVQAKKSLTVGLTKIEKDLKKINIKLHNLKEQLQHHPHNVGKIEKYIKGSANVVNKLKKIVPTLVPKALNIVTKDILPKLARENILEPVTKCLEKH